MELGQVWLGWWLLCRGRGSGWGGHGLRRVAGSIGAAHCQTEEREWEREGARGVKDGREAENGRREVQRRGRGRGPDERDGGR